MGCGESFRSETRDWYWSERVMNDLFINCHRGTEIIFLLLCASVAIVVTLPSVPPTTSYHLGLLRPIGLDRLL